MVAIKNLLFLVTAASALILPRADFNTVLTDLKQADTDTNTLTSQVNAYTGGGAQILTIRQQITKLKNDLSTASTDTDNSPTPSAADGQTVLNYVGGTLLTDTKAALTAVQNKQSTFTNAGVKGEVLQNLKDLKSAVDTLSDKLIAKAPTTDEQNSGTSIKASYDTAFNNAITAFS